ncbi:MAG TPA: hypothetical protein VNM90_27255 [Haliangium sp.]|nr:hypothetical protein [Haliangium sp.]
MKSRVKTSKKQQDVLKILESAELGAVQGGNVACASTSQPPPVDPPVYV